MNALNFFPQTHTQSELVNSYLGCVFCPVYGFNSHQLWSRTWFFTYMRIGWRSGSVGRETRGLGSRPQRVLIIGVTENPFTPPPPTQKNNLLKTISTAMYHRTSGMELCLKANELDPADMLLTAIRDMFAFVEQLLSVWQEVCRVTGMLGSAACLSGKHAITPLLQLLIASIALFLWYALGLKEIGYMSFRISRLK